MGAGSLDQADGNVGMERLELHDAAGENRIIWAVSGSNRHRTCFQTADTRCSLVNLFLGVNQIPE